MFLEVLALTMRYCSYRIAFVILQYESNTDLLSQNILHILNQSTSLERGLLSSMFDITTIELSVRSSLLDTVLNRNTGILKRDGLSALVQTMMKLMPA